MRFDSLANMPRRLPMPHYVGKVSRSMVECGDLDTRIVGGCKEPVTRSETGANDTQLLVTLLLQPIETTAQIENALARSIDGAGDVGRNGIVGTAHLGGPPKIVMGHSQEQSRIFDGVEDRAQRVGQERGGSASG